MRSRPHGASGRLHAFVPKQRPVQPRPRCKPTPAVTAAEILSTSALNTCSPASVFLSTCSARSLYAVEAQRPCRASIPDCPAPARSGWPSCGREGPGAPAWRAAPPSSPLARMPRLGQLQAAGASCQADDEAGGTRHSAGRNSWLAVPHSKLLRLSRGERPADSSCKLWPIRASLPAQMHSCSVRSGSTAGIWASRTGVLIFALCCLLLTCATLFAQQGLWRPAPLQAAGQLPLAGSEQPARLSASLRARHRVKLARAPSAAAPSVLIVAARGGSEVSWGALPPGLGQQCA